MAKAKTKAAKTTTLIVVVDADTLKKIDAVRVTPHGTLSRSAVVRNALKKAL